MTHIVKPILVIVAISFFSSCMSTMTSDQLAEEYYYLGSAYFEAGEFERSSASFKKAYQYNPELNRISLALGRAYIELGRLAEARELLEKLFEEDPENLEIQRTIAYLYAVSMEFAIAETAYRSLLELSPGSSADHYNLGLIYIEMERKDEAEEYIGRAYALNPEELNYGLKYAEILADVEKAEDAIIVLEYLSGSESGNIVVLRALAKEYEKAERFAAALKTYLALLSFSREDKDANYKTGIITVKASGEIEKGLEYLEKALILGFADVEQARNDMGQEDFIGRDRIEALFTEYELPLDVAEEEQAAEPGEGPAEDGSDS